MLSASAEPVEATAFPVTEVIKRVTSNVSRTRLGQLRSEASLYDRSVGLGSGSLELVTFDMRPRSERVCTR